ncbi:MAG: dihydropteroate synthase [Tannerella sp.]|jgi:dihydropteroate synthase|nr:dihydropteroate synthase [Tannerella sp.]
MFEKFLNLKGRLMSLEKPLVMGILNVTPDSFYAASRQQSEEAIRRRIEQIIYEGGTFIDVGGYSTRPDAAEVSEDEEWQRLKPALNILQRDFPDVPVSVDTFRPTIARRAIEDCGVALINDISGGEVFFSVSDNDDDDAFLPLTGVPYILMHIKGTPRTMHQNTSYEGDMLEEIMLFFAEKLRRLHLLGVNDVIIDPGFGFSKTVEQNYKLMSHIGDFKKMLNAPVLVGISRKSMIYKVLGTTSDESLNGTTVLNTYALMQGADILRVHDVKAAVEAVKIIYKLKH